MFEADTPLVEMVARLRAAAHDDRPFDTAKMQLINLPEVIHAAGAHWPALKDKLRWDSTRFLRACLEGDDLVIPAGDGFLIVFAQGERLALRARAEQLRELLLEVYAQSDALKQLGIRVHHARLKPGELSAMFTPPPDLPRELSGHVIMFAPAWSARARMIAAYLCTPVQNGRAGYDESYAQCGRYGRRDYDALDLSLLDAAQIALESYDADPRPAIGVSIHATTMQQRAGRLAVIERLSKFPRDLLKHLVITVAEIEPYAPVVNLADWTGTLRAYVQNVLLEFHHSETPPDLAFVGAWAAGFRAPAGLSEHHGEAIVHARQVQRWGETMTRTRRQFFVADLERAPLVKLAANAGANFFTSATLWPYGEKPGGVVSAPAPFREVEKKAV